MTDKQIQVCRDAININGQYTQTMMLFEVMAELQDAICKYIRDRGTATEIITEIADVRIMCEQMAIIYGKEAVEKEIDYKIKRLKGRLAEQQQEQSPKQ